MNDHSSPVVVLWNLSRIQFDCRIQATYTEVKITSSVKVLGWNVKSKAWKYWPAPNWGQISKLIHQGDVTEDDPQLSAVSPDNVTSNLYFYFSWGTCRSNHWIYIHLHCKQYVNQKKKTLLRLINLSAQFIFYIHLYDVNDESARAGMHLLEQTDCLEMHCANILSTGCFM